jgi:hypothetical protein
MDTGMETITAKGRKLQLDAFQFVGISSRNKIPQNSRVFKLWSGR